MIATDYVMDNYFKYEPGEKHLYRAISSKIEEFKKILLNMSGKIKKIYPQTFLCRHEK